MFEEKHKVVKILKELFQLDLDAVHAYEEAIAKIDYEPARQSLISFKLDHLQHMDDIDQVIMQYGEITPNRTKDVKGELIEGFTKLRSLTGTEGALKAMRSNEKMTNAKYQSAFEHDLPLDVRTLIQKNREDERRHLNYIETVLQEKPWETFRKEAV